MDVVYRNNNTAPAAVEYLSVAKDSVTDRIAINFIRPEAEEQTVYVGDSVDPKNSISNTDILPNGATFKFKEVVDTSKAGKIGATVIVSYRDGMSLEVQVVVNVLERAIEAPNTGGKSEMVLPIVLVWVSILGSATTLLTRKR